MHGYVVVRKLSAEFETDECSREVGNLEAAVDPVMVSEGNKCHPLLLQPMVKGSRSRIAIGKIEPAKKPFCRSVAKPRMKVEIDFRSHPIFCGQETSSRCKAGKYLDLRLGENARWVFMRVNIRTQVAVP